MTDPRRPDPSAPRPLPGRALLPLLCALVLAAGLTACGGLGLPGSSGPAPTPYPDPDPDDTTVTGEVLRVNPSDREIELDEDGRRRVFAYAPSTPVFYEGRSYQPTDLERGDLIRARVVEGRYSSLTIDRIDVVESVQSRGGSSGDWGSGDWPYDDGAGDDWPADDRGADRDDDWDDDWADDLSGEIDRVDADRREMVVRTTDGDRLIAYDGRTRVVYQGRDYEPEDLERGDLVEIDTTTSRDSRYALATRIDVTRSVQDRTDYDDDRGRTERLTGTVDWVDRRRGELGLRTDRGTVTVEVPFDASNATRDRFGDLDRGDSVRIEAEELERGRFQLVRFL